MAAKKKPSSSKSRKSKAFSLFSLLSREQQMDALAVGLLALAVFTALSLLPANWLGERGADWNAVGMVGGVTDALLTTAFGSVAGLFPVVLLFSGLYSGGWGKPSLTGRVAVFTTGLLLVAPLGAHVLFPDSEAGGWLGVTLGDPLGALLGWLGATLLTALIFVLLSVLVLRWNPLRAVTGGVVAGAEMAGRGLRSVSKKVSEWWKSRPAASEEEIRPVAQEPARPTLGEDLPEESDPPPSAASDPESSSAATVEERIAEGEGRRFATEELPPLDLLEAAESAGRQNMESELDRLGEVLLEKLGSFNVKCKLGGRTTGPVVTQFEVVPAAGVKVNRIANLDADLALAMKAPSIRIVAPIPGKGAVGVEIPNPEPAIVRLSGTLSAKEYQSARGQLPLALGDDLTGKPYVSDLAVMPHLLIAGATGSGKSVCVNTIVTSLVYRHGPETLRLLLIDPKMVELSAYADLPHLRHPVVTEPTEAAGVLRWAVLEMDHRYRLMQANGVRSISEFNQRVRDGVIMRRVEAVGEEGDEDRWIYDDGVIPFVVVVVDELADLMLQVQGDVERPLAQLAQKARAIGIHLIVATQRPSVNVITGLIKANFPTRIAFRVASKTDSRTILDQNGAEALLGNGDMLFLPPGQSEPVRIQGAFIATEETNRLISWYRAQEAHRLEEESQQLVDGSETDILDELRSREAEQTSTVFEEAAGEWDELFRAAAEVCVQHDQGSTSLLQRRLRIGYGRAARIVDQLHDVGILGPPDGSKPREVLVSLSGLDAIVPE